MHLSSSLFHLDKPSYANRNSQKNNMSRKLLTYNPEASHENRTIIIYIRIHITLIYNPPY